MRTLKTLALVLALSLCFCGIMAGCGDADPGSNPEEDAVTSIRLRYNGAAIPNNTQTVPLTLGTLAYTAEVTVSGKASKDFTLESSEPGIATVSAKTVTLHAGGQTKITAIAVGDTSKKHTITLNVVDTNPYSITVDGGTATVHGDTATTALAGTIITLTPGTEPGKVFSDWTIEPDLPIDDYSILPSAPDVVMLSANSFVMPAYDVLVRANFESNVSAALKPFAITNNFGQDSSTEFVAQWHHNSGVTTQKLQIVMASGSFGTYYAKEIPVTGESFETSGDIGTYALRNVFRAHVTDLSPNTRYKYRMGDTGAWSPVFYHLTSKGTFADFSFTVITDPQDGVHAGMTATLNAAKAFDEDNRFFLNCGDLTEQIGSSPDEIVSYTNAANIFNSSTPISATQGNHDTYDINGSSTYEIKTGESTIFNAFVVFPDNGCEADKTMSQSYYYYYNKVLIIMLNTLVTSAQHTVQVNWLKEILDNDRAQGLSKYTIVGTHIGPFGNHYYDDYWTNLTMSYYGKVFSDYEVDIVFHGHDHTYTRTNPIKIETGDTLETINFAPTPGGTIYSIAGSTGPKRYGEATSVPSATIDESFVKRTRTTAEIDPGVFVNIKVTGERLSVTAMRRDGIELDTYEVPAK